MNTTIAAIALLVSLAVAWRQWRRDGAQDKLAARTQALEVAEQQREAVERSKAWVVLRLVEIDGTYWWKLTNLGASHAHLLALHAYPLDLPHDPSPLRDESGKPIPADPPLHDPRLLDAGLPPGDVMLIPADPCQPPGRQSRPAFWPCRRRK